MSQDVLVQQGSLQNPYQEFTLTIPASGSDVIRFDHANIRILAVSGGALKIQVSDTGAPSSVIGAGMGFNYTDDEGRPLAVKNVRLLNSGGTTMTVTVGLSMHGVSDNRLSISGTITVGNTEATPLWTQEQRPVNTAEAQVSVSNASVTIAAARATRKSITIEAGAADLYVSTTTPAVIATSFRIPAGAALPFYSAKAYYGIRATAGAVPASYAEEYN